MTRKSWDDYFMDIARQVATRATCPRRQVGAVFVRDKRILSTGYNGSLAHRPHCTEVGCQLEDGRCVRTVHAEANAIAWAARVGMALEGADLYVTSLPCWRCFKDVLQTGVRHIYYVSTYAKDSDKVLESGFAQRGDLIQIASESDTCT